MSDKYVGTEIGNFSVLRVRKEKTSDGHKLYDVQCTKCGQILHHQRIAELLRKNTLEECFHLQSDTVWHSQRLRKIYHDMKRRCYDPSDSSYSFYGEKGIRVCSEWRQNPQFFNDWAIENGYNDNLTIDRISEDGDYTPENCHWISFSENAKWKSTTRKISVDGITDSGKGWARRLGTGVNYVNKYLRANGYDATVEMIRNKIA